MNSESATMDPRVAAVLAAAAAPAEVPTPGEDAALAEFRRMYGAGHRRAGRLVLTTKLVVAGGVGGLLLAGGVAAAATGNLSLAPELIGISGHHHASPANAATPSDAAVAADYSGQVPQDAPGQGARISDLATSSVARGIDKGVTICTAASHGKCRAGDQGKASTAQTHRQTSPAQRDHARTPTTPQRGGQGADDSANGQATASTHDNVRPPLPSQSRAPSAP